MAIISGIFNLIASLTRRLQASRALTAGLRMTGKVYVLREILYYGVENP